MALRGVAEVPWFLAHARTTGHDTVWELNSPAHCRTCGQMEPFGELIYGNLMTDAEVRSEVTRIVRTAQPMPSGSSVAVGR